MKNLILLATIIFFSTVVLRHNWDRKEAVQPITPGEPLKTGILPDNMMMLPVGDSVFFSAAPSRRGIRQLKQLGIIVDIRLNGNGKDAGPLAINAEALICEAHDMRFRYYNIDGGDQIEFIINNLDDGHVLIHCKHGAHRAPLVAGCYMLSKGMKYEDVINVIGWDRGEVPVINDPRYKRYVDTLKDWASRYWTGPVI